MKNQDIRQAAKDAGLKLYELCPAFGVSEPTLFRWLRDELPVDKKKIALEFCRAAKEGRKQHE